MFLWDCFFFSLIIWFFLFFTMFSKVPAPKVAFLSQKSLVRLWSSFSLELHQLGFCCGCTHHSLPFLEIMVVWPPEAFSELCLTAIAFLIQSNGRKADNLFIQTDSTTLLQMNVCHFNLWQLITSQESDVTNNELNFMEQITFHKTRCLP